jgi:signal transduction histidine kinase
MTRPVVRDLAGRWHRLGLRAQLMLIGLLGLATGLALGGVVLVAVLQHSLQRALDSSARQAAVEVAELVTSDRLPDPIPVAGAQSIQVVDAGGRVLATSVGVDHLVPMVEGADLTAVGSGRVVTVPGDRLGSDGPVRVLAVRAGSADGPRTVLVASPVSEVDRAGSVLRRSLLVAFPLLLALLAGVAWRVIGLTLRPVESLRRSAEEITGSTGEDRLPVPASRDEIYRLAVTLNSMLDRLEAARDRQRAFVADAAHELRNPLASMLTQLEVAQRARSRARLEAAPTGPAPTGPATAGPATAGPATAAPDPWDETAADLVAETQRLARLVDDLLLLARSDAGAHWLQLRPVPISVLGQEIEALAARRSGSRVPVTATPPTAPAAALLVPVDLDALRRILDNLLDNAVRHAAGRVVVSTRVLHDLPAGAGFEIVVRDDGPGLPPHQREQAFGRFTRLDPARAREDGGAGLGLAIVAELVALHHGTVALDDAGPGLVVTIRLPARTP